MHGYFHRRVASQANYCCQIPSTFVLWVSGSMIRIESRSNVTWASEHLMSRARFLTLNCSVYPWDASPN
jgi:hypothetical protein